MISIVIPCFNAEPWIRETIQSVVDQGLKDVEITVVDDGSSDKSADIIKAEFPFVNLIKANLHNPGKARNVGTDLSKGEFIQYLDADDLLAPGKLTIQLSALKTSGADVAYGDWQKLIKAEGGAFIKSEVIARKLRDPEIDLFTDFWCPPAAYLFRRSIIKKIGGWNEKLPVIQDARFALDCALHGAAFTYCSGIMAYYRTHLTGSVSTRDSTSFVQDCFKNANDIRNWWGMHGGMTEKRKLALLKVYGGIARASFEKDKPTFAAAYQVLETLSSRYIPGEPYLLKYLSMLIGYKKAESIALLYRRIRNKVTSKPR